MFVFLRTTALVFALAGALAACALAFLTTASIVGRALWAAPLPGDVELTQFGIALCISLCLPWCQLRGANITVDFFTVRAAARTRRVLDGLGALTMSAMMALLAWRTAAGAVSVQESHETSMILGLPMWVVYAVLAPGFALTLAVALYQAWGHLRQRELPEVAG
ncbi:TRAP transporter small permease [Aquabacterium sp. A7-Y]|uniref:TRAP transporter small permease n=1 Tax=Aquabacterium sp. A7-Y TaxID=1349605 RepID=UPI00223DF1EE|nr:TRAP transporter small permease [Aquabacterium sp. A7-Y]MCW7539015.1 TRAP transporter small permease [Aquabacterium sp. A7-Y]